MAVAERQNASGLSQHQVPDTTVEQSKTTTSIARQRNKISGPAQRRQAKDQRSPKRHSVTKGTMNTYNPESVITNWLTMLRDVCRRNSMLDGYAYAGIGDFLLQHGVWYKPRPLPKRIRRGMPRACFGNALMLAARHEYKFVEGYAVPALETVLIPVHHAWVIDSEGNVIDNTWSKTGLAYFGVEFPQAMAMEAIAGDGHTVLDNLEKRHEIYRKPYVAPRCLV
jgi:hypothetical protein